MSERFLQSTWHGVWHRGSAQKVVDYLFPKRAAQLIGTATTPSGEGLARFLLVHKPRGQNQPTHFCLLDFQCPRRVRTPLDLSPAPTPQVQIAKPRF